MKVNIDKLQRQSQI